MCVRDRVMCVWKGRGEEAEGRGGKRGGRGRGEGEGKGGQRGGGGREEGEVEERGRERDLTLKICQNVIRFISIC